MKTKTERYILNGHKVQWKRCVSSGKITGYALTIGASQFFYEMFGDMIRQIEKQTGVAYPF